MRIAYVFDQVLPSSATDTEQAVNTVAAMQRNGADVTLVLPRPLRGRASSAAELREYYEVEGDFGLLRLRSIPRGIRPLEKVAHAARAAIDPEVRGHDLIYTRNIASIIAALATGRKVAYETYRPWPAQHTGLDLLFRRVMTHRNFVLGATHSAFARKCYIEHGVPPDAVEVVYNGYAPERFSPVLTPEAAQAEIGLENPDRRTVVGYVGRVSIAKGLGLILDVAARHPDVLFLVVGSEGEGEVERRARRLENVRVYPWQAYGDIPPFLFASDVLVIPPTLGPLENVGNTVLPMKLFLYLAAGRAVLAANAPDTAELLEHDRNAFLVEPDDVEAASRAVGQLADDDALRARLAEGARETAAGLTWDARAKRILALLEARMSGGWKIGSQPG